MKDGQGLGVGSDRAAEGFLDLGVGSDMIFVAVGVDDLIHRPAFDGRDQLPGCMSTAGIDQQAVDPVGGRKIQRAPVSLTRFPSRSV